MVTVILSKLSLVRFTHFSQSTQALRPTFFVYKISWYSRKSSPTLLESPYFLDLEQSIFKVTSLRPLTKSNPANYPIQFDPGSSSIKHCTNKVWLLKAQIYGAWIQARTHLWSQLPKDLIVPNGPWWVYLFGHSVLLEVTGGLL